MFTLAASTRGKETATLYGLKPAPILPQPPQSPDEGAQAAFIGNNCPQAL